MQILFAAPFLLAAGLVFMILSLIPRARRWGVPVPTGILATAPCLIVALLVVAVLAHWIAPTRNWQGWWAGAWLGIAGVAALLGGVIAGVAARFSACVFPELLLRAAVFVAAWCSYFVLMAAAGVLGSWYGFFGRDQNWIIGLLAFGIQALLCFIAAFFIAKRSEDFRPQNIRLPWGTSFRLRGRASVESASVTPAPDAR
jgi:hypothetical protein